jgi:hypothetical protein
VSRKRGWISAPTATWSGKRKCRWLPQQKADYVFEWPAKRKLLLQWVPWKGIYAVAVYGRCAMLHTAGIVFPKPEWYVKKKGSQTAGASTAKHSAPIETELFRSLMGIVEHCAMTRYDDGDARQPGWVTVKTLGAAWQIQAKDPDGGCALTVTAASLDDALVLLDALLRADDAPWEPDQWLLAKKKPSRK